MAWRFRSWNSLFSDLLLREKSSFSKIAIARHVVIAASSEWLHSNREPCEILDNLLIFRNLLHHWLTNKRQEKHVECDLLYFKCFSPLVRLVYHSKEMRSGIISCSRHYHKRRTFACQPKSSKMLERDLLLIEQGEMRRVGDKKYVEFSSLSNKSTFTSL